MNSISHYHLSLFHKRFNKLLKIQLYNGILWKMRDDIRNTLINVVFYE